MYDCKKIKIIIQSYRIIVFPLRIIIQHAFILSPTKCTYTYLNLIVVLIDSSTQSLPTSLNLYWPKSIDSNESQLNMRNDIVSSKTTDGILVNRSLNKIIPHPILSPYSTHPYSHVSLPSLLSHTSSTTCSTLRYNTIIHSPPFHCNIPSTASHL